MILAQAAVSDVRLRLSAGQFSSRLSAVVSDSAPLVVRTTQGEMPLLAQFPIAEPRTSIGFRAPSPDQIVGARPAPISPSQFARPLAARRTSDSASVARSFASTRPAAPRGFDALPPSRPPRKQRLAFVAAAILIVVVAVGGGVAWKLGFFKGTHPVPELVGSTLDQASVKLQGDGFTLNVTEVNSIAVPKGEIVSQSPSVGTAAKSGLVISVDVSKGPASVTLPTTLIGRSCAGATASLKSLHVSATCATTMASTRIASGLVAEVLFGKTVNPLAVPAGSRVSLVISAGPGTTTTTSVATTTTTTTTTPTSTTTTTLAGQGLRAVPNLIGMDQAQAYAAMRKAQLYFSTRGPGAGTTAWKTVVSEVPAAGTMVKWHSNVVLNVKE
jgi:beta-lactam-binding protein with PASTA domain